MQAESKHFLAQKLKLLFSFSGVNAHEAK